MATSQDRRSAQRRIARQLQAGTFEPSPIGGKARTAANRIKIADQFHPDDRQYIREMIVAGWWENGESLTEYRRNGSAESVYNYARSLADSGVPSNIINVTPHILPSGYNRTFDIYATRDTG